MLENADLVVAEIVVLFTTPLDAARRSPSPQHNDNMSTGSEYNMSTT